MTLWDEQPLVSRLPPVPLLPPGCLCSRARVLLDFPSNLRSGLQGDCPGTGPAGV